MQNLHRICGFSMIDQRMTKNFIFESNEEILQKLVTKMINKRKKMNLTQKELAEVTGVSFRTIQKLETGGNITLINFIAILRGLGQLHLIDLSSDSNIPSPKAIHKSNIA